MNTIYISNDIEKAKEEILQDYHNVKVFEDNELKLELVKEIKEFAYQTTKEKVFVLIKAINLRVESQNALLKLLEETPINITFLILTTSKYAVLETIRSRMALKYIKYPSPKINISFNPNRLTNNDIYEILKQKMSKNELKSFIYELFNELNAPSQKVLQNFEMAIKLVDLNANRNALCALLMLSIRQSNASI